MSVFLRPRASTGRVFLPVLIALGFFFPAPLPASWCSRLLDSAEQALAPVPFDESHYATALESWSQLLSAYSAGDLETQILERFRQDGSFESQAALLGALLPEDSVSQSIQALRSKSVEVFSRDVPKLMAFGKVVPKVRWAGILRGRFPKSPSALVFNVKHFKPKQTLEWVQNLVAISEGFRKAETAAIARNAPWLSTPFQRGNFSYPRALVAQLEKPASRTYAFLHAVREKFPELEWKLKERAQRPLGWVSTSIGVSFYFVWMFYDPLKGYAPTEQGYRAWLDSPTSFTRFLEERFTNRARIQYAATVSKRIFKTALAVGAISASVALGKFYFSGNAGALGTQLQGILNIATDPEQSEKAVKQYQERPGGDPGVIKYFDDKIAEVEKEIESLGESPERRQRIKDLEALRDDLKN